jgi:DNA polymerase III alpha subunit
MIGSPDSRAKAIAEIKSFGYEIGNVDINESGMDWEISKTRKAFVPSFSTLKAVGNSAIEEILQFRPYTDVKSLLYDENGIWKNSKFNRRTLDALIKMGAFQSLQFVGPGNFFSSYKHMYYCIIENQGLIRKSTKKDPQAGWKKLQEIAIETWGMEEWTKRELAMFQKDIVGSVDALSLIPNEVKEKFEKNDILSIDFWTQIDIHWFVVKQALVKKTKKGKNYLLLEVVGESGVTKRMYMWDWDGVTQIEPYTVCLGEIDNSEFGFSVRTKKLKILA